MMAMVMVSCCAVAQTGRWIAWLLLLLMMVIMMMAGSSGSSGGSGGGSGGYAVGADNHRSGGRTERIIECLRIGAMLLLLLVFRLPKPFHGQLGNWAGRWRSGRRSHWSGGSDNSTVATRWRRRSRIGSWQKAHRLSRYGRRQSLVMTTGRLGRRWRVWKRVAVVVAVATATGHRQQAGRRWRRRRRWWRWRRATEWWRRRRRRRWSMNPERRG